MKQPQTGFGIAAAALAAAAWCGGAGSAFAADPLNGRALAAEHGCAACHGSHFDNPINAAYPRLAGQHADYLVWAMRQYQMGLANPLLGRSNPIMQAQVQSLSAADMQDIAAYLESLHGSLVFKK